MNVKSELSSAMRKVEFVVMMIDGIKFECPADFDDMVAKLARMSSCIRIDNHELRDALVKLDLVRLNSRSYACATQKLVDNSDSLIYSYLDALYSRGSA